nr:Tn3 family transposase post-transcriptional regulator TnpC [Massilia sp. DJPM01]
MENTTPTAYGLMDGTALAELRSTFDTTMLLRMVDELAAAAHAAQGENSLRESVLRLHAMAHTAVNGAGMTVATDDETLPELAETVMDEMRDMIARLQSWISQLEPLLSLEPRH